MITEVTNGVANAKLVLTNHQLPSPLMIYHATQDSQLLDFHSLKLINMLNSTQTLTLSVVISKDGSNSMLQMPMEDHNTTNLNTLKSTAQLIMKLMDNTMI
jgi:hypothetical protein